MKPHLPMKQSMIALSVLSVLSVTSLPAMAQDSKEQQAETDTETLETIQVTGRSVSYANSTISSEMKKQQTPMTSALSIIDNLPGVLVNEGDPFGSDEWSTSISMRTAIWSN
jgi:type II secretory pathway pseudopilin PulG